MVSISPNELSESTASFEVWSKAAIGALIGDKFWPASNAVNFRGSLNRLWVDDVLVVDFRTTGFAGGFAADSPAYDYIGFGFAGDEFYEHLTFHNDVSVELGPGFCSFDPSAIKEFRQAKGGGAGHMFVPRSALRSAGLERFTTGFQMHQHGPVAKVLQTLVDSVLMNAEEMTTAGGQSVRNAVLDLLAGASAGEIPTATAAVSDAMRDNVKGWVRSNLMSSNASPSEAAVAHGISVRSLHRLFSESGDSFGAFVRRARLDSARQDLSRAQDPVQTIAMRWRYADASHFCREFKKAYGQTPMEYRNEKLQCYT